GLDGAALVSGPIVQRALDGKLGTARVSAGVDRPVIGLGASAGLHYGALHGLIGQNCVVPDHADVANAIGAVVGQVRISADAMITQPVEGVFRVSAGASISDHRSEEEALLAAIGRLREQAARAAREAGSDDVEI